MPSAFVATTAERFPRADVRQASADDLAVRYVGKTAGAEQIHAQAVKMGFTDPLHVQYGRTMTKVFTGDLISYYARARDNGGNGQEAKTDIYFMSVRPFDQTYKQAEQAGGLAGLGRTIEPQRELEAVVGQQAVAGADHRVARHILAQFARDDGDDHRAGRAHGQGAASGHRFDRWARHPRRHRRRVLSGCSSSSAASPGLMACAARWSSTCAPTSPTGVTSWGRS